MIKLLNIRIIYLLLFFFLSGFFFYFAFLTYKDYSFPYTKLNQEKGTLSKFTHVAEKSGKQDNESEKFVFDLNSGVSIILYEGFDDINFKTLKQSKQVGSEISCKFVNHFKQGKTIYNPKELIINKKAIVDYSKRKKSDFQFIVIFFSCGMLVLIISIYLLSAVLYVIRNVDFNPKHKTAKRVLGNWFIS